ncbi:MAG: hypothetical protein AAFQ42_04210 [Pseudomonadota bacterium]
MRGVGIRIAVCAASLLLAGCAATNLVYPSTANIDRVPSGTLSPAEAEAVIDDLQKSANPGEPKPVLQSSTGG